MDWTAIIASVATILAAVAEVLRRRERAERIHWQSLRPPPSTACPHCGAIGPGKKVIP